MQRVPVADLVGQDAGAARNLGHAQAHQVVGDAQPPEFLRDAVGAFATQRGFFTFQRVSLELVVSEFEFPAFVIEGNDSAAGKASGSSSEVNRVCRWKPLR